MSDNEIPATESAAAAPGDGTAAPRRPARRGIAAALVLIVVLAVLALAWLAWRSWQPADDERRRTVAELQRLQTRVEATARTAEQARRDADSLRERLDDAARVNQSLREQLLGLGERARLVEDAVTNLADKRLSGHDALLLDETEMLLALGGERYTLFHDAAATIDAYRAADTTLTAVGDAAFSTVRQSISAEIEALTALRAADTAAALATLAALRGQTGQLAPVPGGVGADRDTASEPRWLRLLGQFVRVRHDGAAAGHHEPALARQLLTLDLREAEAALLARDEARFHAALGEARALLDADFDAGAAPVRDARRSLDALAALALAPAPPKLLGTALGELRNLRATHALHAPPLAPKAPATNEDRP